MLTRVSPSCVPERLFPVLDLVRLAVRHADVNTSLCSGAFASLLISNVLRPSLTPKSPELTRLMAIRVAANMLAHPAGERLATENSEFFLSVVAQLSLPNSNPSPRQQIALATLLFNLSVASLRGHPQLKKQALPIAALTLPRLSDVEAQRRCLRALTNILSQSDQDMLNQARDKKLPESLAILLGEASVAEIAGKILAILP